MERKYQKILFLLVSFLFIFSLQGFAQDIKARMKARLPIIKAMKGEGVVGENNLGYLEFIGEQKKKEDIVQAENTDRKRVYTVISKKQGTTKALVGKRRAAQISQKANPGVWIQDPSGNWSQKK
jgi:uncharacterized protein